MHRGQSRGTVWALGATILVAALALAGCNGDDIQAVAQKEGLAGRWGIALYTDPAYVDYTPGSAGGSEAENLEAFYSFSPEPMVEFGGTTGSDFAAATRYRRLLVIPELEVGDLGAALDTGARDTIRNFVADGGVLVVFYVWRQDILLNNVFGFALVENCCVGPYNLQPGTAGTRYAGGPASLPDMNASDTVTLASLPTGSLAVYADSSLTQAAVAQIPYGAGRIVILGWDWFDAPPLGTSPDFGWLEVLARASKP